MYLIGLRGVEIFRGFLSIITSPKIWLRQSLISNKDNYKVIVTCEMLK